MSKVTLISKEEAITKVTNSISSIYSKEDVLNLIKSIDDNIDADADETYTKKEVINILERVKESVTNNVDYINIEDVCDLDNIELTLSGREIEIDTSSVDFDSSEINSRIEDAIDDIINDYE